MQIYEISFTVKERTFWIEVNWETFTDIIETYKNTKIIDVNESLRYFYNKNRVVGRILYEDKK